jgi:MFS family permease
VASERPADVGERRPQPTGELMVRLLREPARPAVVREHRLAPWFAVGSVCFGAFMGQLDASVVTLAFPVLQRQFGARLAEVQWVSLAYLLVLIALLVPVGRWSDKIGRKLVYLYGFVVFAGASAASGLAPTLPVLIGLRAVQAAGAAMLQDNSVALVSTSTPAAKRRAALGVQAAAQALGLAAGPVAGGLLIAAAGWRWIFLINVPVGLIAVVAGVWLLPRSGPRGGREGADLPRILLLAAAAAGLLTAMSSVSGLGLPIWAFGVAAAIAGVAGCVLLWWERRSDTPSIDTQALTAAGAWSSLAGAMCAYTALFGPLVLLPQMRAAQGSAPLATGPLLAALPGGFGLTAIAAERLFPPGWPNQRRCAAGGCVAAGSLAALATPAAPVVTAVALAMLGAGLGAYVPANNTQIMAATPARDAAKTGGMVSMARGLGTALGVALVALGLHVGRPLGQAAADGIAVAVLLAAVLVATWAGTRVASPTSGHTTTLGERSD